MPTLIPKAEAPQPELTRLQGTQQPRQRGFVRFQHAAREPPPQPIPMETARDSVYDLPDHVWRNRPTREPGRLTMPQPELLVHPNTEVRAMDVDDDAQRQGPRPLLRGDRDRLTPSKPRRLRKSRHQSREPQPILRHRSAPVSSSRHPLGLC